MSVPQHEQAPLPQGLAELKAGRSFLVDELLIATTRPAFQVNEVGGERFLAADVKYSDGWTDQQLPSPALLLSIEAAGIELPNFLAKTGASTGPVNEVIAVVETPEEKLMIGRYDNGATMRLIDKTTDANQEGVSSFIVDQIKKRLERSPAHRALQAVESSFDSEHAVLAEKIETMPFPSFEDPLGTLTFMEQVGLLQQVQKPVAELKAGIEPAQVLRNAVANLSPDNVTRSDTPGTILLEWQSAGSKYLKINAQSGEFVYGVANNKDTEYLETPNQGVLLAKAQPFVETDCAEQLMSTLDDVGLMLHPGFQYQIMKPGAVDRYGSMYTMLTREIAKWVDNPARFRLSNLFVPYDKEYTGIQLAQMGQTAADNYDIQVEQKDEQEVHVRSLYEGAEHIASGEAAGVMLQMIGELLDRETLDGQAPSDLPVTQETISIKDGSCFDAAIYYVDAARSGNSYLRKIKNGSVEMLEKTLNSPTFLTTHPIVFNGVHLPKGALFGKEKDGWFFQRLTPFTFDNPNDQLAFGSEITKAHASQEAAMKSIGTYTLKHLIERT